MVSLSPIDPFFYDGVSRFLSYKLDKNILGNFEELEEKKTSSCYQLSHQVTLASIFFFFFSQFVNIVRELVVAWTKERYILIVVGTGISF